MGNNYLRLYGKYKLTVAIGLGSSNYMRYGGRHIRFSEVLGRQCIGLTEQYVSLAVF